MKAKLTLAAICCGCYSVMAVNLTVNPGFETTEAILGYPETFGDWGLDRNEITGSHSGITARSGTQMLHFINSFINGDGTVNIEADVAQLIDVSGFAPGATAFGSAWFNRVAGGATTDTRFAIELGAFAGSPADFRTASPLSRSRQTFLSDSNPATWELLTTSLVLPVGTDYLAIYVSAVENVSNDVLNEFDGHFGDDVSVTIASASDSGASATLLAVGMIGLAGFHRLLPVRPVRATHSE